MGEKSDEIERYIEQKRNELGDNLSELEHRVKRAVNWRAQVEMHPISSMAIAVAGGILLSTALAGRRSRVPRRGGESSQNTSGESNPSPLVSGRSVRHDQKAHALDTWENIKDALVGVAAAKVVNVLDRAIPGFQSEFQRAEGKDHTRVSTGARAGSQSVVRPSPTPLARSEGVQE